MQNLARYNDNFRYLLTCICVFSKFAFAIPVKDKRGASISDAFEKILKRKAVHVHRSPVVFITTFTGFHGCSAIAGDVYNKSHLSSPVQRLSLAGSARWAELRPGAEVRRAACRCNTQAGRHRCYRCHRCAGALSAITGW
jgi:hypothetical protein